MVGSDKENVQTILFVISHPNIPSGYSLELPQ